MRAMVLCAGYGTRLGELTRATPKPMLRLVERPILEVIICHLARHGFNQIAVNLHFMPELIQDYFGDGARWNVEITYAYEPDLLGTAGGVRNMAHFLGAEDVFMVYYGDVITDQDLSALVHFHRQRRALATLLLHQRVRSNSVVSLDETGCIVGFLERPGEQERQGVQSRWVNSGIHVCSRELLDEIPAGVVCDLPRDVFPRLVNSRRLYGFPLSGYRCAIDSPERLAETNAAIADRRCRV